MRTLTVVAMLVVSCSTSCTSTRPQPEVVVPAGPVATALVLDSLADLPPYLVPAPVGSSPRQRRQWQKAQATNLARAGVLPTKIKNSSVATAPGAVAVTRSAAPVAVGAAAVATAVTKPKAAVAVGDGNTVAPVTKNGLPWWLWVLFGAGCCAIGWRMSRGRWT